MPRRAQRSYTERGRARGCEHFARTDLTRTTMPVTPHPESAPSLPEAEARRLDDAAARLVDVATHSLDPAGGFGWLDDAGRLTPGRPAETWVTCRMTHTFALAHLHGDTRAADLVDHGVQALRTTLHDDRHGGWLSVAGREDGGKEAYAHAFVVLAAASATGMGHPDGRALLDDALGVMVDRFWDEREGLVVDQWDASWTSPRPLPRRQRQHAHGRVLPRRGGRHGRPGLARPGDPRADPGRRRLRALARLAPARALRRAVAARCSTTTSTTRATRSSPTA